MISGNWREAASMRLPRSLGKEDERMAKEATSWIQMVSSAIGGALGWYFGSIDGIFYA